MIPSSCTLHSRQYSNHHLVVLSTVSRWHSVTDAGDAVWWQSLAMPFPKLFCMFRDYFLSCMELHRLSYFHLLGMDHTRLIVSSALRGSCSRTDHVHCRCTCRYRWHPPCAQCTNPLQSHTIFPLSMLSAPSAGVFAVTSLGIHIIVLLVESADLF